MKKPKVRERIYSAIRTPEVRERIYSAIETAIYCDREAARVERRAAKIKAKDDAGKLPFGHVSAEDLGRHAVVLRATAEGFVEYVAHIIETE